jgi:dihydrofolate synthase/folylpolyglutamate synthase
VSRPSAAPIRTLDEAAAWLESLINVERQPDLPYRRFSIEPIRRLLARLGDPHRALSAIHVAGSKGKGSTVLLAEAILLALGEKVGTFTSPHLESWAQRFRLEGRDVEGARLAEVVARVRPHVEALRAEDPEHAPTCFDAATATALLLFQEAGARRVLLEVGLGGRLDSTNVVDAAVACVTSIELEHTDRLGTTLGAIAGEKAAILKSGRPAVAGRLPEEAERVVVARAAEVDAPLARFGRDFTLEQGATGPDGTPIRLHDGPVDLALHLPLLGGHHAHNAALALACVRRLGAHPPEALAQAARRGLEQVLLPGRVEILGRRPWLIVDSAHTVESARALAEALRPVPRRRARLVLSVSAGKDLPGILRPLLPLFDGVFVTRAEPTRSLAPEAVAEAVRLAAPGLELHAVPNPHLAVRAARSGLGPDDLLCAAGSVYLAGIARRVLRRDAPEPLSGHADPTAPGASW